MNTASKITVQALISVVAAGALLQAETDSALRAAASLVSANNSAPAIIWSPGVMKINGATHNGSGNVVPGNRVEMLRSSGQLYFTDGTRLRMGADTSFTLDKNADNNSIRMESGVARIDAVPASARPLHVKADDLQVIAGSGTISRPSAGQLVLTASALPMSVTNGAGLLVATVNPGQTLSFQTMAFSMGKGSASPKDGQLTGVVSAENSKFFISDEASNVKYQILGGHPKAWKGKRAKLSGEIGKAADGSPTIRLENDKAIAAAAGAGAAGAAAAGAAAGTAAGAAAGISTAVIAGVVVTGAAIAGTTVALVSRESKSAISQR